jgi:glutamate/tyrosine decarboxylase-like PLP-dependent enzyme
MSSDADDAPGLAAEGLRRFGYRAIDVVVDHLAAMRTRPVFRPMGADERRVLLEEALPERGLSPDAILEGFRERILLHPMGNGHPRFFGWANSPPAALGILGDLLAAAMNPSCAGGDHAAIYVERCAVRWLMELVGFPTTGSMGLLVSGGSMASLVCLAAARHHAAALHGWNDRTDGMQGDRPRLVFYVSEEGHSCLKKAAELLGLGEAGVRTIAVDDEWRMDVCALRDAVAADRAAGRRPFCVAASAGSVNTGAIDPLEALAELCSAEQLWLHVDGAIGGVGALDPALAPRYAAMSRADSVALDPHKWLSVPVECGCALVRDGALLRDTFSLVPPYLRTEEGRGFGGLPWYSEYGFQQTRGFRALKLWMTLQHMGRAGVARLVSRHRALAQDLAREIDAAPDLERLAPVELAIVCFRYTPADLRGNEPRLNALNKVLVEEIQTGGEVFLTGTMLKGRFALRASVMHYATTEDDVAALVEVVRRVGARLASGFHA